MNFRRWTKVFRKFTLPEKGNYTIHYCRAKFIYLLHEAASSHHHVLHDRHVHRERPGGVRTGDQQPGVRAAG